MANTIKAFAIHDSFVSNSRLEENPFGELSTDARTYERDIGLYTHNTDKSITLALFQSINSSGADVTPASSSVNFSLDVAKAVYDYTIAAAGREIYRDELKRKLLDLFSSRGDTFTTGEVVHDGNYYCVQWVAWRDNAGNQYQVWFSDKAFKAEYDDFQIEVVMAVENPDIFFSTPTLIKEELAKTPVDVLTRKANNAKGNTPVTVFRLDIFPWYNPANNKPEIDTNWYILIWGDAGDNVDSVKEAIQEAILAKSTHTRDEWKRIFPDIFKRNEFIIVPQWDVFANENKVKEQASLYSPLMNYATMLTKYGTPYMAEIPSAHMRTHAQCSSLYYRSLVAMICSSPENKDSKFKLTDIFPDFIDVPSTSTDFNYQSTVTQEWSLKLQDMLAVAETMTKTSSLPRERVTLASGEIINGEKIFTRVERNGKLFLVMKFKDFHYLVAAKSNFVR